MALDNFQAQVGLTYDEREVFPSDPLGYRDRNTAPDTTTITVFDAGTTNISTLYETNDVLGPAKSNPFNTDNEGWFQFYAADGSYDIIVNYVQGSPDNRGWYDQNLGGIITINNRIDGIDDSITNIENDITNIETTYPTIETVQGLIDETELYFEGTIGDNRADLVTSINNIMLAGEERNNIRTSTKILETDIQQQRVELDNTASQIVTINQTIVTDREAEAARFVSIETNVADNAANVVIAQQAITDESSARALAVQQLNARVDTADANISSNSIAIANETSARTAQITTLTATVDDNTAQIVAAQTAITDEVTTRAAQFSQLTATDNTVIARLDAVEVDVDGNATAVSALESSVNNPTTGLSATYNIANTAKTTAEGNATAISGLNVSVTNAQNAADAAQADADTAQTTADAAQTDATSALSLVATLDADTATSLAQLQTSVTTAQTTADGAQTTADAAQTTANSAQTDASSALTLISDLDTSTASSIATLQSQVTAAQNTADGAQTDADAAQTTATSALTLATQVDNSLDSYRAVAQLAVNANGTIALIQLDATPTLSQITFQGSQVVFKDTNNNEKIFFDTINNRFVFNGHLEAETGTFNGTIYAQNIEGDVTDSISKTSTGFLSDRVSVPAQTLLTFSVSPMPFSRVITVSQFTFSIEDLTITSNGNIPFWIEDSSGTFVAQGNIPWYKNGICVLPPQSMMLLANTSETYTVKITISNSLSIIHNPQNILLQAFKSGSTLS